MMVLRILSILTLVPWILSGACSPAKAQQDWPTRPIKLIVPFPAGGNTDILGRIIAERIQKETGGTVVIENRPGAGANIGAEAAARSPADGYTLFIGTASTHGINKTLYKELRYDPVADFDPIILVARSPLYLVVTAKLPVGTVAEFIAYAKQNAGKVSYGSVGKGSPHHLAGELLKRRTGIEMMHVPYRGSAPALTDLIGGTIQFMFDATAIAQAKGGQLRVLAVASKERWKVTPEIPSLAEQGVPDFEVGGWFALFAPAKTPPAVLGRVNAIVNGMLKDEAVVKRLNAIGLAPAGGTGAEMAALVKSELVKWGDMVRLSGATIE
jgi:tripartite-type tricarboxylate transporter receptor subunit TctC